MKNYVSPPMIHWFSFYSTKYIKKDCNHSKANKAEQESNTKTNTLIQKQTSQQNITAYSTITKQIVLYITTHRHQRICFISLGNHIIQIV